MPAESFRILGIDPGIALVGYGILEIKNQNNLQNPKLLECGVISTPAGQNLGLRLKTIREDLKALITKFKPDYGAVELIYFAKNAKTAIMVAQARGVIMEALTSSNLRQIAEFTPTHLKQVLFGHGKADKKQIQMIVSQVLGLPNIIKPDDAADATAIGLALLRSGLLTSF